MDRVARGAGGARRVLSEPDELAMSAVCDALLVWIFASPFMQIHNRPHSWRKLSSQDFATLSRMSAAPERCIAGDLGCGDLS